jgi:hypothetical protein
VPSSPLGCSRVRAPRGLSGSATNLGGKVKVRLSNRAKARSVADIHDRMPVILRPADYDRWLGLGPDPRDLLRPFPADLMRMWPISTRVNAPRNDDPDLLEPVSPDSSTTPTQGPNSL